MQTIRTYLELPKLILLTLFIMIVLTPRHLAAFFEDLCYVDGEAITCVTVPNCDIEKSWCRDLILTQALKVTAAGATNTRSMLHLDSTYILAMALGFRQDIALTIALYNQGADTGVVTPLDSKGTPVKGTRWTTANLPGFVRVSQETGGFIWHLGVAHNLDRLGLTGRGLHPNVEDIEKEGGLARMRRWALQPNWEGQPLKLCSMGLTEGDTPINFDGEDCLNMSFRLRYFPYSVDPTAVGLIPALSGLNAQVYQWVWGGDQIISYEMEEAIEALVFEDNLQKVLNDAPGRLNNDQPVPASIAAMGIYLHMLQDRISHYECGDVSGLVPSGGSAPIIFELDNVECSADWHAARHYTEIGNGETPPQVASALSYTLKELKAFKERYQGDYADWFPEDAIANPELLVGTGILPGQIPAALALVDASERLDAMNGILDTYDLARMPGQDEALVAIDGDSSATFTTPAP